MKTLNKKDYYVFQISAIEFKIFEIYNPLNGILVGCGTYEECERMIKSSYTYGVKLSVVHNQRFYPPFLTAQKMIENGSIGKLNGL